MTVNIYVSPGLDRPGFIVPVRFTDPSDLHAEPGDLKMRALSMVQKMYPNSGCSLADEEESCSKS